MILVVAAVGIGIFVYYLIKRNNNSLHVDAVSSEPAEANRNVGEKIKRLSTLVCIISIINAILVGLLVGAMCESLGIIEEEIGVAIGAGVALIGIFIAVVLKWFVYGYGELITNSVKIELNTRR